MTARSDRTRRRSFASKLMLSGALFVAAALVIGVGAYALFTDTESVSQSVSSGTVSLAPINVNAANNRLSVAATNIAAGDTIERTVDAKNTGSITLASVTLTTTATTSSLLDTDATNGLQMVIDKCSVAWTESAFPYTYTCSGTQSSVVASRQVIGSGLALSNLTLTANTDNFLRVKLTLPTTAGNTFQNLTSVISYGFTATQRNGQPA
ncbi:MAG TPA: TasA family protein [Acidimicrobiia bacterium]|jgi:predicted ribosomally synthesized peptide with SipW-like signal peptide